MNLAAFELNCTLKSGPQKSSTRKLLDQKLRALAMHGVDTSCWRAVDHDIKPGVSADEGERDAWPPILKRIMDAQFLVVAAPISMGQPSSVSKRVLERLDAVLGDIDKPDWRRTSADPEEQ
jgi:multimeric flavodoxin WrbA